MPILEPRTDHGVMFFGLPNLLQFSRINAGFAFIVLN